MPELRYSTCVAWRGSPEEPNKALDYRWFRHPEPGPNAESTFWIKTGWSPSDLRDKDVLDYGCGNGEFAAVAARFARRVLAVDSGKHAVAAAEHNLHGLDNVSVYQASQLEPGGIEPESFDVAYSIGGALHTSGNPQDMLRHMAAATKVNGQVAVWLQCNPVTHNSLLPLLDFLHDITREVPIEKLYEIIEQHAPGLRNAYAARWEPVHQVLRISNDPDDATCVASTYAWHATLHRSYHGVEEVAGWFQDNGLTVDRIGEFLTSVRGHRAKKQSRRAILLDRHEREAVERQRRRVQTGKPLVLLISDVRGWAFDQNFHDLEEALKDRFDFEHGYVWEWIVDKTAPMPDFARFDVVFAPYHRWNIEKFLPMDRTLGALRAQWIFPERKRQPGREEFNLVNSYAAYQVVTRRNYAELKDHCPRVVNLTNCVNMRRFPQPTPVVGEVIASWNGNAGHSNALEEDVKGYHSIILPACAEAEVELKSAEYSTSRRPPHEMPAFYYLANLSLSASLYEGASSSVMEGMAAGHALIATDVGNHREMHESMLARTGESGIVLVERSAEAFVKALEMLKHDPERVTHMGRLNREEITLNWSWDAWKDRFADFLMMPLRRER